MSIKINSSWWGLRPLSLSLFHKGKLRLFKKKHPNFMVKMFNIQILEK